MQISKRELYLIITATSIIGAVYPYVYSHFPTNLEWSTALQTSAINSTTQLSYPWTLFNATPSFSLGGIIGINVTYSGYSCYNPMGCQVSPEICIFTVIGFNQMVFSRPPDQQAAACGGLATYNNATASYAILFQPHITETSEYMIISRLASSCSTFEYQCPGFTTATLTITQPTSVNPLQWFGDPQLISLLATVSAVVFGALSVNEHKRHH